MLIQEAYQYISDQAARSDWLWLDMEYGMVDATAIGDACD
jgi:hypothetical protein